MTIQTKYLSLISLYYSIFSIYSHLQIKIYEQRKIKRVKIEIKGGDKDVIPILSFKIIN